MGDVPTKFNKMAKLRIKEAKLTAAGFEKGAGASYYYPISDNNYHIHVGASHGPGVPKTELEIDYVAIKNVPTVSHGQNLRQNHLTLKYDLNTPDIKWGENETEFKDALIAAGIGYSKTKLALTEDENGLNTTGGGIILAGGTPAVVPGPELVSMAQAFTGLPMNDLIGGPLMAAAKANNQMALTQTQYILDTGFIKNKDDKGKITYQPLMIDMEMSRPVIVPPAKEGDDPVISEIKSTVKVPMLTIMPVNALAVDEVDISFDMEVKSSYGQKTSKTTATATSASAKLEAKLNYGIFSASVTGSVSSSSKTNTSDEQSFNKSNTATYHVEVHAAQQPMPPGLNSILQEFAKNLGPVELPQPATKS